VAAGGAEVVARAQRRRRRRPAIDDGRPRPLVHGPHLAGASPARLVVAEAAVLAVVLAWLVSSTLAAVLAVPSLALVGVALGRREGRWLSDALAVRTAFRARARATPPRPVDRRLGAFGAVLEGVAVREVVDRSGHRVGVLGDGDAWVVLLELMSPEGLVTTREARAGGWLADVAAALAEPSGVLARVQVVTTTVPAPAVQLSPVDDPRRTRTSSSSAAVVRRSTCPPFAARGWRCGANPRAAVQQSAPAVAASRERTARCSVSPHVSPPVSPPAVRPARLLDVVGVTEALHFAGDVDAADLEVSEQGAPREQWGTWVGNTTMHASFAVRRWPGAAARPPLDVLGGLPASRTRVR
jgi:hypothetical protein